MLLTSNQTSCVYVWVKPNPKEVIDLKVSTTIDKWSCTVLEFGLHPFGYVGHNFCK